MLIRIAKMNSFCKFINCLFCTLFSFTLFGSSWCKNILDKNLTPEEIQSFAHPNISGVWVESVGTWYMPLMSRQSAEQFREILIGEPAPKINETQHDHDWNDFCLREIWTDPTAVYKGLNESQVAKCLYNDNYFGNCTYWSDRTDDIHKAKIFMTHTDNENYIVAVRIWIDEWQRETDWFVFSKYTSLSPEIQEQIIKGITELGFDPKDTLNINYDGCNL